MLRKSFFVIALVGAAGLGAWQLRAKILSWSHSRGVFLGAAFKGAVIKPDASATEALYGEPRTATEILVAENVEPPDTARHFIETATASSRRSTS